MLQPFAMLPDASRRAGGDGRRQSVHRELYTRYPCHCRPKLAVNHELAYRSRTRYADAIDVCAFGPRAHHGGPMADGRIARLDLSLLEESFHDAPVALGQAGVVDAHPESKGVLQSLIPAGNKSRERERRTGSTPIATRATTGQLRTGAASATPKPPETARGVKWLLRHGLRRTLSSASFTGPEGFPRPPDDASVRHEPRSYRARHTSAHRLTSARDHRPGAFPISEDSRGFEGNSPTPWSPRADSSPPHLT